MKYGTIGVVAAMPEELRPLLKEVGSFRKGSLSGFTTFSFPIAGHDVLMVQSGMGLTNGRTAAKLLVEYCRPDLLISTGFAGGVTASLAVGDIILANRMFLYEDNLLKELVTMDADLAVHAAELLLVTPRPKLLPFRGTFITTAGITSKSELACALPSFSVAAVDMETSAIASVAAETGTPFMAIRAISDGANEELGFTIEEITDSSLQVKTGKVLLTIARKPWIVPQLLRLAKNSTIAGNNLGVALKVLLEKL